MALVLTFSCGRSSTPPPPPPKSPVPTPTVLRSLYRFVSNGSDRVTTFGPNERASYPLEAQAFYIPDQPDNGRVTLNRVVNASGTDHADTTTTLNGYSQDLVLGYPWSNAAVPGVVQLTEASNSSTGVGSNVLHRVGNQVHVISAFAGWGDGPSETASDNTAWSAVYGNGTDVTFPAADISR